MRIPILLAALLCATLVRADAPLPASLERSYWVHASLAADTRHGYWGLQYPRGVAATDDEIGHAARLLADDHGANRLYLVFHDEIPATDVGRVFAAWRANCPARVELVPALVLRAYDRERNEVFATERLPALVAFFQRTVNATNLAVYDVYPGRDQGAGLGVLEQAYPGGLIRLGVQPGESLKPPFRAAVQDTWSAFCHGKSNEAWRTDAAGLPTLRRWVAERNTGTPPVVWDLIAVAWDYAATADGRHPGYDDAAKNQALPAGRNQLAVAEILQTARPDRLAGFSSDLLILEANSRHVAHDGPRDSFYETLKRGEVYRGCYAVPLRDIATIFAPRRAATP